MRSLVITAENLENQRQAVKEERRLRVDNQPYAQAGEKMDELLYDSFAYRHSVIGSMADLDAATVADVKQFFKTYYAPNNAVVALVGDLDTKDTLARVRKFFATIPRQDPPQAVDAAEADRTAERRAKFDDPLARLARVDVSYRIPPQSSPDSRALQLAAFVLGNGDSSRLYQRLVKEKGIATQVRASAQRRAGPGEFGIIAQVQPGKSAEQVEEVIAEEVAKLSAEPVTAKELQRARVNLRRTAAVQRENALARAQALADGAALYNDPGRINTDLDKTLAITPAEIQKAARTYLRTTNRNVIVTTPAARR